MNLSSENTKDTYLTWRKQGVTCILSHFKTKPLECKHCGSQWISREEKETDVRIALEIYRDAIKDHYDRAYIVSADSDLVPPVRQSREDFEDKGYFILTPPGRYNITRDLGKSAHGKKEIKPAKIRQSLFDIKF